MNMTEMVLFARMVRILHLLDREAEFEARRSAEGLTRALGEGFVCEQYTIGESANFKGEPSFLKSHGVELFDLRDAECIDLMATFIKQHPELWHEDIGK